MNLIHSALHSLLDNIEAKHAVVSPGSRNAPVINALIRSGYEMQSVIDERSAGFQALGMAKSLRQAVVLSCTSGTAALNYYPAIAEAFYARVPLIVLTADRPKDKIDQWDGQAIRQSNVFDQHCRLSLEIKEPADEKSCEKIADQVNSYLEDGIKGPIHINIPIREPFYLNEPTDVVREERKFLSNESILLLDLDDYLPQATDYKKILVVNGMEDGQLLIVQCKNPDAYDQLVVLSDIMANQASSIMHWDAMLYTLMRNNPEKAEDLKPDVLITTGTTTVSKGLKLFLKNYKPKRHFHISRHVEIGDPFESDPKRIDPYEVKNKNVELDVDPAYYKAWQKMSAQFVTQMIGLDWSGFNEFSAVKQILSVLSAEGILHLANSMAVRYAAFLVDELDALEVFGNRGTSGIDGCSSTALGNAVITDQPVYLLSGDIAFFYDNNAFLRGTLPENLKIIVLNNQGGRIFEFIDGPEDWPERASFQLTSHQRSAAGLCSHYGLEYFCARDPKELDEQLEAFLQSDTTAVFELFTQPQVNKNFYEQFKNISYE